MRHMGNSGRIAIGAFLAAFALLVLTAVTLHEAVLLWFLAASSVAYAACVAEVVIRRRHKTLAASAVGSILFIAFAIAFLRQWGLAFNLDPNAMSNRVDSDHPDLYFYLAAASGAATLLLLFAGTVLPGKAGNPRAYSSRRRPASASRGGARAAASRRAPVGQAPARSAARTGVSKPAASRNTPRPAAKAPGKAPANAQVKAPPAASARPPARTSSRR